MCLNHDRESIAAIREITSGRPSPTLRLTLPPSMADVAAAGGKWEWELDLLPTERALSTYDMALQTLSFDTYFENC